ncbi:MAG TPA: sigma-70 domain-containing protein [Cytophagaceae bacterium]
MKNVEELLKDHKRLIEAEAYKYAKFVPLSYVLSEAHKLAREAAEKYDPKTGIKFSTYLTNQLQKLSRLSTQYGGTVRVPENKQFKINKLNQIEAELQDIYGRPPTVAELADASGLGVHAVSSLLSARKKDVTLANLAYSPVFYEGDDDEWIHFVYHDLSAKDKFIFEHRTGFGGKKIMDNNQIAKALGVSPSTISQRIKFITNKISQGLHR